MLKVRVFSFIRNVAHVNDECACVSTKNTDRERWGRLYLAQNAGVQQQSLLRRMPTVVHFDSKFNGPYELEKGRYLTLGEFDRLEAEDKVMAAERAASGRGIGRRTDSAENDESDNNSGGKGDLTNGTNRTTRSNYTRRALAAFMGGDPIFAAQRNRR